jgi:DNA-binding CsgD family transcriptional regulator
MDEHDLAEVVAAAYEAATGGSWIDFGMLLGRFVGAQASSMRLLGGSPNLIAPPQSSMEKAYLSYYRHIDPYRSRASADIATRPRIDQPVLGQEFVPTDEFRRTEYYNDYVRPHGQHHMLGAILKLSEPMTLGLHRNDAAGPFTDLERARLQSLIPHLQRALQLRRRLAIDATTVIAGRAALDALSLCVIVVDASLQVLHANAAAATLCATVKAGLRMAKAGGGPLRVSARHRDDNASLERLVTNVVRGGPGGAVRVRAVDELPDHASLAVLVSPAPARLAAATPDHADPGPARGAAMILARQLAQPTQIAPDLLCDLYGLTRAEASVATSLVGGVTAEDVARTRRVSLGTVRTQVRTVLRKTNAANLRDFERILALVSAA